MQLVLTSRAMREGSFLEVRGLHRRESHGHAVYRHNWLPGSADSTAQESIEGFTQEYKVHRLVYYETYDHVVTAINREKQLKG